MWKTIFLALPCEKENVWLCLIVFVGLILQAAELSLLQAFSAAAARGLDLLDLGFDLWRTTSNQRFPAEKMKI